MDNVNANQFPRIISIIDDTTILINVGENKGVVKGDEFRIFSKTPEVIDPFTGDNLGSMDINKAIVEAYDVLPKMTICKSKFTNSLATSMLNITSAMFSTERQVLSIDFSELSGDVLEEDKNIKIGDYLKPLPRSAPKVIREETSESVGVEGPPKNLEEADCN